MTTQVQLDCSQRAVLHSTAQPANQAVLGMPSIRHLIIGKKTRAIAGRAIPLPSLRPPVRLPLIFHMYSTLHILDQLSPSRSSDQEVIRTALSMVALEIETNDS